MNNKINLIIDTDPGVDDVIALVLALNSDLLDIKLITIVPGNVGLSMARKNTLFLLEKYKRTDVPVAVASKNEALIRKAFNASEIHGKSGFGKARQKNSSILEIPKSAPAAMNDMIESFARDITILALGPLTNVANLLLKHPSVTSKISRIVIMAGSLVGEGNTRPWAEFNAFVDPEALQIVLDSQIPIVMLPMEIGATKAVLSQEAMKKMESLNKTGKFFARLLAGYRSIGSKIEYGQFHDPSALMYLLFPQMFKTERALVHVDVNEFPGKTTVNYHPFGPVEIITDIEPQKFNETFFKMLSEIKD